MTARAGGRVETMTRNPFTDFPLCLLPGRGGDSVSLSRVASAGMAEPLDLASPAAEAYALIFQTAPVPAHDLWIDGRHFRVGRGPGGAINILDLRRQTRSRIVEAIDSLNLCFSRTTLDRLADEGSLPRVSGLRVAGHWETHDPVIAAMAGALTALLSGPAKGNRLFAEHVILALLSHATVTYGEGRLGMVKGGLAPSQERRAMEMLDGSLSSDVSLADLARECGLSVGYFARAFKASTGSTPHDWLQRRRIENARELLASTDQPIAAIAAACGFADQSHLTRVFRRIVGDTPAAWRRVRLH